MAAPLILRMSGSTHPDFLTNEITVDIQVVGVLPQVVPLYEPQRYLGWRWANTRDLWTTEIRVTTYPFTVEASDWDFGDAQNVLRMLRLPYLRIYREGTVLTRAGSTGVTDHLFWTDPTNGFLAPAGRDVALTKGPDLAPDFETGTDRMTFTVEPTVPFAPPMPWD